MSAWHRQNGIFLARKIQHATYLNEWIYYVIGVPRMKRNSNNGITKKQVKEWFNIKCRCIFKLYSNILKCVNLIEMRFYAPSFLVLWHIIYETLCATILQRSPAHYGRRRRDHCADNESWIRRQQRIFEGIYNSNNSAPSIGR